MKITIRELQESPAYIVAFLIIRSLSISVSPSIALILCESSLMSAGRNPSSNVMSKEGDGEQDWRKKETRRCLISGVGCVRLMVRRKGRDPFCPWSCGCRLSMDSAVARTMTPELFFVSCARKSRIQRLRKMVDWSCCSSSTGLNTRSRLSNINRPGLILLRASREPVILALMQRCIVFNIYVTWKP